MREWKFTGKVQIGNSIHDVEVIARLFEQDGQHIIDYTPSVDGVATDGWEEVVNPDDLKDFQDYCQEVLSAVFAGEDIEILSCYGEEINS